MKKLKEHVRGDKIRCVQYGDSMITVKVIENFPNKKVIYVKHWLWGRFIWDYDRYNFRFIDQ